MAKGDHYAQAITSDGEELFAGPVRNDQTAMEAMLDRAQAHGRAAVVIDMTSAGAQLMLGVMARRQVPVAYVSGLVMRRAADLLRRRRQDRPPPGVGAGRLRSSQIPTGWPGPK